jgi:hypothetical protein
MRGRHAPGLVLGIVLGVAEAAAQAPGAPARPCEVPPFRGMLQPGGADARMRVANTGAPCRIRLLADIEARQPFTSLSVTRAPAHGTVTILPDGVAYRPNPGYLGADAIEVAASGDIRGRSVAGRMRVEVTVLAPP